MKAGGYKSITITTTWNKMDQHAGSSRERVAVSKQGQAGKGLIASTPCEGRASLACDRGIPFRTISPTPSASLGTLWGRKRGQE